VKVKVVTDSTSDIPRGLAEQLDITVVPIYLQFGDKAYQDGVDIGPGELYEKLESSAVHPATSQPNPKDFTEVFKRCCGAHDGIVSIHISSKISGTFNSAKMAQKSISLDCPVEVIDSTMNSAGLGLVTLAAARLACKGASLAEVVTEANLAVEEVSMFGMFETMRYLARSGRISKAVAAASNFLSVMPLLTFKDGEIARAGLVRTVDKGTDRIYEFVERNLPVSEVVIVHSHVPERATLLEKRLANIGGFPISIWELGAGLGVHGGPGVLLAAIRKQTTRAQGSRD
jgi:DegV family protein with EDD domain